MQTEPSILTRNGYRARGWTTDYDDAYIKATGQPPGTIQRMFSVLRLSSAIIESLPVVAVPGDVINGPVTNADGFGYAITTDSDGLPRLLYRNAISGKYYDPMGVETQLELVGLMPTAGLMVGPTGNNVLVAGGKSIFTRELAEGIISSEATRILSEAEARALTSEPRGIIFVREGPKGPAAAQEFAAGTEGAMMDLATGKYVVPALRYENSLGGVNYVKFDGYALNAAGELTLIDSKTKLAIWSESTQRDVLATLKRVESALEQNPGVKVVYEFPNAVAETAAKSFIDRNDFGKFVTTRVRDK